MPSSSRKPFLARLREALASRVEATSLRQTAAEIGMTPTGLRYVLDGGDPQAGTLRKLEAWYFWNVTGVQGAAEGPEELAVLVLVRGLPPEHRGAVAADLLARLEGAHAEAGLAPPGWIAEVRALLAIGTAEAETAPVRPGQKRQK